MPDQTAMDAELKTRLVHYLDSVESLVSKGAGQLPDIAREMVAYGFWSSLAWVIAISVLLVALPFFARWAWKGLSDQFAESEGKMCLFIGTPIAAFVLLLGLYFNAEIVIKTAFAPKLYVIEHIASLIKASH